MPATVLRAQLSDQELLRRQQARPAARRPLPDPAAVARALALAIGEVDAGLRSANQVERICHPSLWQVVADPIQRGGGPPVNAASVLASGSRSHPGPGACRRSGPPGPARGVHGATAGGRTRPLGTHRLLY